MEGDAIGQAAAAFEGWAALPFGERADFVRKWAEVYRARKAEIAETICRETSKPKWEALLEVDSMVGKAGIAIEAYGARSGENRREIRGAMGRTWFSPHGVTAVLGPFNMPGHLPNGHLMPAILAGNTVVLKPSEKTPRTGEWLVKCAAEAGIPSGVVNLVQGDGEVGMRLALDERVAGVLFTGGTAGGIALSKALAEHPEKILVLEMGGNNPLVVCGVEDIEAACVAIIQSAYATAGQRCSCARRLIVCDGNELVKRLVERIGHVRVGYWTDEPEPFMGPVISEAAAERLLETQARLVAAGGVKLVPMTRIGGTLLSPGLIDMTGAGERQDEEIFGPLLQLIRVENFEAAMMEANRTRYGLSAGLLSDRAEDFQRFSRTVRAGVLHWNRALTGASGELPFGGIGLSGNHRAAGYLSADYAVYPVGSLEAGRLTMPEKMPPGI